jgi:hypothetical protein
MAVLKWIIILVCAPFILIGGVYAVGTASLFGYVGSAKTTTFAEADFNVGASYQHGEREALFAACKKRYGKYNSNPSEKKCDCWADKAEQVTSRFDRIAITALLNGSTHTVVGLGKSLVKSGIPEEEVNARTQNVTIRYNRIGLACLYS